MTAFLVGHGLGFVDGIAGAGVPGFCALLAYRTLRD
jgi:hypothetical protein